MSVFKRFDFENDVVENQKVKVSSGIFSGGSGTLTSFFTSSTQREHWFVFTHLPSRP